jgi:penicillin-binding protein 1A
VGSTIKPFVYTFAIDHLGYTPCTPVPNLPVAIETPTGEAWQPKEASSRSEEELYDGTIHPLSWGLEQSRNNYTAWIMKQGKQPQAVADFIHRMGIHSFIDPVYALALGTPDVSLFEMVGAYSTFVNRGVFTEPIFVSRIEDRYGNLLATFTPATSDAISEQTAYTMVGMLQNVVAHGTATRLRRAVTNGGHGLTAPMGGKTGTSQESSDAWFMGITPKLVAGAWVGGEYPSVHLRSAAEGATLALPIYGEFMRRVYADPSLGISQDDQFYVPQGAVAYRCDPQAYDSNPQQVNDEFFN